MTKTLDQTRPVIGNDGWESVSTDIVGIHDCDDRAGHINQRYRAEELLPKLLRRERPGGRQIVLDADGKHTDIPVMLSEFGGIAIKDGSPQSWGYSAVDSPEQLELRYAGLLRVVRSLDLVAGFCYTQFADTYQETNGLLSADRTPKFPLARMARATRGPRAPQIGGGDQIEWADSNQRG